MTCGNAGRPPKVVSPPSVGRAEPGPAAPPAIEPRSARLGGGSGGVMSSSMRGLPGDGLEPGCKSAVRSAGPSPANRSRQSALRR